MLPSPGKGPHSDTTALVVAATGVLGPIPYVMAVAALRMVGGPRRSWKAAAAIALAMITIVLHTVLLVWLAAHIID